MRVGLRGTVRGIVPSPGRPKLVGVPEYDGLEDGGKEGGRGGEDGRRSAATSRSSSVSVPPDLLSNSSSFSVGLVRVEVESASEREKVGDKGLVTRDLLGFNRGRDAGLRLVEGRPVARVLTGEAGGEELGRDCSGGGDRSR